MDRFNKMLKMSEPFFRQKLSNNFVLLKNHFDENRDKMQANFSVKLKKLYALAIEQQKENEKENGKEAFSFLYFSYLRTTILMKDYNYKISLHNKDFHLDSVETCQYIKIGFLFKYIEQDIEELKVILRKDPKLRPISSFDENELAYRYSLTYMFSAMFFLKALIKEAIEIGKKEGWQTPVFSDDFTVVFGGNMEPVYEIYSNSPKFLI